MSSGQRKWAALIAILLFESINVGGYYLAFVDPGIANWATEQFGPDGTSIEIVRFAIWLAILVTTNVLMLLVLNLIIRWAGRSAEIDIPSDHPGGLIELEHEVVGLIHLLSGYETIVFGDPSNDSVDVKVFDEHVQMVGIVRIKYYAPDRIVNGSDVRSLEAARYENQAESAYLVTTGRFSEESYRLAKNFHIHLIDGAQLSELRRQAVQR